MAYRLATDQWFEADLGRVVLGMTQPQTMAGTQRSAVHPLFILLVHPPVGGLQRLGLGQLAAVLAVVATMAGLWLATLYGALRVVGLRRPDAVTFALVAATSAAALFWLTVPETYALGSLTIVVALGLVALASHRRVPAWATVAASAGSLSITTTNWMAGIAATVVGRPWRRAALLIVSALAVVLLVWGVQKVIYPGVEFFIGNVERSSNSKEFFSERAGGPGHVLKGSLLFPEAVPVAEATRRGLTVQKTPLSDYGLSGTIAAGGWIVLLGLGAWALRASPVARAFRIALALTLAGQVALALVYGTETFLYALNFVVLLILVAALAATTRLRPLALAIAVVVAGAGAINNYAMRQQAVDDMRALLPRELQRQERKRERKLREGAVGSRSTVGPSAQSRSPERLVQPPR